MPTIFHLWNATLSSLDRDLLCDHFQIRPGSLQRATNNGSSSSSSSKNEEEEESFISQRLIFAGTSVFRLLALDYFPRSFSAARIQRILRVIVEDDGLLGRYLFTTILPSRTQSNAAAATGSAAAASAAAAGGRMRRGGRGRGGSVGRDGSSGRGSSSPSPTHDASDQQQQQQQQQTRQGQISIEEARAYTDLYLACIALSASLPETSASGSSSNSVPTEFSKLNAKNMTVLRVSSPRFFNWASNSSDSTLFQSELLHFGAAFSEQRSRNTNTNNNNDDAATEQNRHQQQQQQHQQQKVSVEQKLAAAIESRAPVTVELDEGASTVRVDSVVDAPVPGYCILRHVGGRDPEMVRRGRISEVIGNIVRKQAGQYRARSLTGSNDGDDDEGRDFFGSTNNNDNNNAGVDVYSGTQMHHQLIYRQQQHQQQQPSLPEWRQQQQHQLQQQQQQQQTQQQQQHGVPRFSRNTNRQPSQPSTSGAGGGSAVPLQDQQQQQPADYFVHHQHLAGGVHQQHQHHQQPQQYSPIMVPRGGGGGNSIGVDGQPQQHAPPPPPVPPIRNLPPTVQLTGGHQYLESLMIPAPPPPPPPPPPQASSVSDTLTGRSTEAPTIGGSVSAQDGDRYDQQQLIPGLSMSVADFNGFLQSRLLPPLRSSYRPVEISYATRQGQQRRFTVLLCCGAVNTSTCQCQLPRQQQEVPMQNYHTGTIHLCRTTKSQAIKGHTVVAEWTCCQRPCARVNLTPVGFEVTAEPENGCQPM